ncbi:D-ribose-binding periplasmic [Melia azedarach]|uniref:D-ribose-binding periplasmic n=1 Tax=Melia azedarach TaxID=155640 RepID=A0ACC1XKE7_MELAZ|nr:D-ribose-binding periplasmic [Melia azedarach]
MGNCQAIDAAALVIQHPNGRIERLYWPVAASEVMRMNPGHYVSLIIPLPNSVSEDEHEDQKTVRFTRVKLLRPTDTLALGHAYRLVTSEEVMKVLRAKKYAKTKQQQRESSVENSQTPPEKPISASKIEGKSDRGNANQGLKHEKHRPRTTSVNSSAMRTKSWRPSLQSISEAGS